MKKNDSADRRRPATTEAADSRPEGSEDKTDSPRERKRAASARRSARRSARQARREQRASARHDVADEGGEAEEGAAKGSRRRSTTASRPASGSRCSSRRSVKDSNRMIEEALAERAGQEDLSGIPRALVIQGIALLCMLLAIGSGLWLLRDEPKVDRAARAARRSIGAVNRQAGSVRVGPGVEVQDSKLRPKESSREISGRIVDRDGAAISRASIRTARLRSDGPPKPEGPNIQPDGAGRFALRVDSKYSHIEVRAEGYASRTEALLPGQDLQLELVLERAKAITGQVVTAETGQGVEGARVRGEGDTWFSDAKTDASGHFRFEDAPSSGVSLFVTAENRVPAIADGLPEVVVRLAQGRVVRGLVLSPSQQIVSAAAIQVFSSEHPGFPRPATSDEQGRFSVGGFGAEEELLIVAQRGDLTTTLTEPWRPFGDEELVVTLSQAGSFSFSSAPPEGMQLLPEAPQPGASHPVGSEVAGRWLYRSLAPGAYRIELKGRALGSELRVLTGEEVRLEWPEAKPPSLAAGPDPVDPALIPRPLPEGGSFVVRVVDMRGVPLPGAQVVGDPGLEGVEESVGTADENGRVTLSRRSTRMSVVARHPGHMIEAPLFADQRQSEIELVMVVAAQLSGQLVPAVSGQIALIDPATEATIREASAGGDGVFLIDSLPPGRYLVEAFAAGYIPLSLEVTLPLPSSNPIVLRLSPAPDDHALGEAAEEEHEHEGH